MNFDCYIINLDRDHERWNDVSERFRTLGFNVIRVPAIDGKTLQFPHPDFAAWRYFFYYGRPVMPGEIGCYFSYIKTLKTFLSTNESHCLICEDDVKPATELPTILDEAMKYSDLWDLLRLNAIRPTSGVKVVELTSGYYLSSDLKTASGNGCALTSRPAAKQILAKLLPMRLPLDVALFYSFPIGIREMTVQPFPVALNEKFCKDTTIIGRKQRYPILHPASLRHIISLPYRICSRTTRKISRLYWGLQNYFTPPRPKKIE
ncbi:MAG: glycosyltransferase family 25 protein [Planctomycetaceae bacterium]|jgi:glycosyl transferase family 25|nr:glycosyltransferase family 25 protein [Planctomycetaceae bacterium]